MERVCVMGLGYIGLPTAIIAAEYGYNVVGYDVDSQRVERINNYDPVIQEPELFEKLSKSLASQRFRATTQLEHADYFIIAVPTPFKEEKKADLSYLWRAATSLVPFLQPNNVIILESTVPVGTTNQLAQFFESKTGLRIGHDIFVVHCPERVLPGKIFIELIENPRIIGGVNTACLEQAKIFYKRFVKGQLYLTNATTAEMVKLVENSSRDVEIAFANQVAAISYTLGLDPFEVIELANKHPRVDILNPSCGVGGHCIAVDPWFLIETFPEQTKLLKAARIINDDKPFQVISLIRNAVHTWQKHHTKSPTLLALGVTYKPNIDDIRESPALTIAKKLSKYSDMRLLVCEPHVDATVLQHHIPYEHIVTFEQGLAQADIIICLVQHAYFKNREQLMEGKKILDFCGLLYKLHRDTHEQEKMFWPTHNVRTIPLQEYGKENIS